MRLRSTAHSSNVLDCLYCHGGILAFSSEHLAKPIYAKEAITLKEGDFNFLRTFCGQLPF
jgi:hypothetical protein